MKYTDAQKEALAVMTNRVSYKKLTSFPLGSIRKRAIETKYQYKSNTLVETENNYDYALSMILQSVTRQDSLIVIDCDDKIYNGSKRFFKDKNYETTIFSPSNSHLEHYRSFSIWEKASSEEEIRKVSSRIIEVCSGYILTDLKNHSKDC